MIKLDLNELVDVDGTINRLPIPAAKKYQEDLKKSITALAALSRRCKNLKCPSHFSFESVALDRHMRKGEKANVFLDEDCVKAKVKLSPFIQLGRPELRGGTLIGYCRCLRRDGMQVNCRRWGCQGKPRCTAGEPGIPRVFGEPVEPTCCESWLQRASEASRQLKMHHFERAAKRTEQIAHCRTMGNKCLMRSKYA